MKIMPCEEQPSIGVAHKKSGGLIGMKKKLGPTILSIYSRLFRLMINAQHWTSTAKTQPLHLPVSRHW